jgi:hypothetical protein
MIGHPDWQWYRRDDTCDSWPVVEVWDEDSEDYNEVLVGYSVPSLHKCANVVFDVCATIDEWEPKQALGKCAYSKWLHNIEMRQQRRELNMQLPHETRLDRIGG